MDVQGDYTMIAEKDGLPERSILDLKATEDGRMWVLSYNGIHQWKEKRFISYPFELFESIDLWGILPVTENEIWIFTSEGIFVLDPESKEISKHAINTRIEGVTDLSDLVRGRNGDIYIVGKKVYLYKKDASLEEIRLPDGKENTIVFTIREDDGKIWFLTDEGLMSYDWKNWNFFPQDEMTISDMIKVKEGEYWLGCNSGIAKFDGENYYFFGFHDGIAVEECTAGAALIDRKGRVWFGGQNITIVYPESIRKLPGERPLITRAEIGKTKNSMPEEIIFHSRQKSLELHFSTPSYFNEQKQVYRYRMRDLEPEWSKPTKEHSVRYANLSPGNYTFEVQSRQRHGEWDGPITQFPITVIPAFWQTTLARVMIILLLIMFGFFINIARVKRLKVQKVKLKKVVDEQTREIRNQRDELARRATTDELTGLPNRRKFEERLEMELVRSRRYQRPLSLFIFDIDNFKEINDSYGHIVGDEILKLLSTQGKNEIREIDFLARWGGDEFVFFMPETGEKPAIEICRRLKDKIESSPLVLSRTTRVKFTISGGISTWDVHTNGDRSSEDIFKEADQALYRAKNSGGDKICHGTMQLSGM
jgi:diguanylate cyclase (GGDEF)-like protein